MELHPFRARRERRIREQVDEAASRVAVEIIDHLSANEDMELRIPVGPSPRKINPGDFLNDVAERASVTLSTRTASYAGRLAYDHESSRHASTHIVRVQGQNGDLQVNDWRPEINTEGLTMVFTPVADTAKV